MALLLPSAPGTYALHLHLPGPLDLEIGRLGRCQFPAGELIYVGSAFGPGGLRARVGRHLNLPDKHRWHIDYILPFTQPGGIWIAALLTRLECPWVAALASLQGAHFPAVGFGSSDCRNGCVAHLLAFIELDPLAVGEWLEQIARTVGHSDQTFEYEVLQSLGQSRLDDLPPLA
jgi:Uri superfamily endonuclease